MHAVGRRGRGSSRTGSPDGARIAFESVRASTVTLSEKPSGEDGREDVLFASPETKIPCDGSSDGRFLVYYVPNPQSRYRSLGAAE
jgi:hypothetical protein